MPGQNGFGGRVVGLLALVLSATAAVEGTSLSAVVIAVAAAVLVSAVTVVRAGRLGTVGRLPGEVLAPRPAVSSRITDPLHHPVRPRAPGLV